MREILFRGKSVNDGNWVEGYLIYDEICNTHIPYIGYLFDAGHDVDVAEAIPETVGQFTGLTDKDGKKIFEGDIIEWDELEWGEKHRELVERDHNLFAIRKDDWGEWCEVIGNIHDNPELLEVEG